MPAHPKKSFRTRITRTNYQPLAPKPLAAPEHSNSSSSSSSRPPVHGYRSHHHHHHKLPYLLPAPPRQQQQQQQPSTPALTPPSESIKPPPHPAESPPPEITPESVQPPRFKTVTRYTTGSRRVCFVNFDRFPGAPTPAQDPPQPPPPPISGQQQIKSESQSPTASDDFPPKPPALPAAQPSRWSARMAARERPGGRAQKNHHLAEKDVMRLSAILSPGQTPPQTSGTEWGWPEDRHTITVTHTPSMNPEATTAGPNPPGNPEEAGSEGSEEEEDEGDGAESPLPSGHGIFYTKEQESWIISYVAGTSIEGQSRNWLRCSAEFKRRFNQSRKVCALRQKWKTLAAARAKRLRALEERERALNVQYEKDVAAAAATAAAAAADADADRMDTTGSEPEPEPEPKPKAEEDKDDADTPTTTDEYTGYSPSQPTSPTTPKYYTTEEKAWLLGYIDAQMGLRNRKDWVAASVAYKERFGYHRSSSMLCQKWKDLKLNEGFFMQKPGGGGAKLK